MRGEAAVVNERQEERPPSEPVSVAGTADVLRHTICGEIVRLCAERYGGQLRAIVLTGSMARDEATFALDGNRWNVSGDVEFLLIFHDNAPLPPSGDLDALHREAEVELSLRNLVCHVSLSCVHSTYLRKLKPHVFAYELKTCGQVVWGEADILSHAPGFAPAEIPLEDAWRMVCNRMVELLEVSNELEGKPANLPQNVSYRVVKLYLDMATSYLLFAGAYAPTYRQRAERLRELVKGAPSDACPFPLGRFADRVTACTELKLMGGSARTNPEATVESKAGLAFWTEALEHARLLWRWELTRLTGAEEGLSDWILLERWMHAQPIGHRLRGWLYVLRKLGWWRSWRHWPRWIRYGWEASPRYWVYAVAGELFFRLPGLVSPDGQRLESDLHAEDLRRFLPVVQGGHSSAQKPTWRVLRSDVVWNYHEFLEGTRV